MFAIKKRDDKSAERISQQRECHGTCHARANKHHK